MTDEHFDALYLAYRALIREMEEALVPLIEGGVTRLGWSLDWQPPDVEAGADAARFTLPVLVASARLDGFRVALAALAGSDERADDLIRSYQKRLRNGPPGPPLPVWMGKARWPS